MHEQHGDAVRVARGFPVDMVKCVDGQMAGGVGREGGIKRIGSDHALNYARRQVDLSLK